MRLSEHFTLEELTRTSNSNDKFALENSSPPPEVVAKLTQLCNALLEPIRKAFGPVSIHSGYRSKALNKRIGGSEHSQHLVGEAADFHISGRSLVEIFSWIKASDLEWGQLILEGHAEGRWTWIHISLPDESHHRQVLKFNGVSYIKG